MKRNESLVDVLLELQALDRVPRMGFALRGVADSESVAEHSFHVATIVWMLAVEEPGIDALRALELALLHDVAEVRTGDIPLTAARYLPAGAKHSAERQALEELLAPMAERAGPLAEEIAAQVSPEARFVKACDKLQLMLKVTVYEHAGTGSLAEFWQNEVNFPSTEFPSVAHLFDALREKRTALGLT